MKRFLDAVARDRLAYLRNGWAGGAPWALVVLVVSAGAQAGARADGLRVTDLRIGVHGAETRFVLELTAKVAFKVRTLARPYRVVVDLPELGWQLPPRPLPRGVGLISRFRYGLFDAGTSRVVLDVTGPVRVKKAFLIPPAGAIGYRFVLDLAATGPDAFVAGLVGQPGPGAKGAVRSAGAPLRLAPPERKPRPKTQKRVIAIDPGHGGVDPGAVGGRGVFEKNLTLAFAREAKRQLEATGKFRVVLTRSRDIFIRLRERIEIARKAGAELFISLHADTIRKRGIRGLSVYTLSEKASDREAAELAEKENKADLIAGIDLTDESPEVTNILIDLAQRETMNRSARFASRLIKELRKVAKLLPNSHRFAGFAVLKAPDVPSVLVELGFLSNARDARALRSPRYRAKLARALRRAVATYFSRVEQATRF